VGIIVNDLAAATAFFLDFGLELEGEGEVEGLWVDRVVGLKDVKSRLVMLRTPDGQTKIELAQFERPVAAGDRQPPAANTPGIRHITFVVDDIEALVAKLQQRGSELVGEIQTYEDFYKVCYIRGPEGMILELAEQLGQTP
jgi:catechol 2,3-dioxygenase-like lactoylglutathione lyase family enzyme